MFSEFRNAFGRPNNGHVQPILINVVAFLILALVFVVSAVGEFPEIFKALDRQFTLPPRFADFASRPWTILTYAFSHSLGDIWHIVFNMITLYWFGKLFIEYLGSDKLIALYVLGALAGAAVYLLMSNTVPFFMARAGSGMVGASGAVYAVLVACATLLPDYTFFLLFLGPVRIKYIALFFIVVSFLGTVSTNAGGNLAHLGGALMGYVYTKQLQSGNNWGGWITAVLQWIGGLFRPRIRVTHRRSEPSRKPSKQEISQKEIDDILDKISAGGYDSLSKEEKEKLFRAGKN